jgi:hypothetical protein
MILKTKQCERNFHKENHYETSNYIRIFINRQSGPEKGWTRLGDGSAVSQMIET